MTTILAIDPGSERSAWLVLRHGAPALIGGTVTDTPMYAHGIDDNAVLLSSLRVGGLPNGLLGLGDVVVVEEIRSFMLRVGADIFDTVRWAGRFEEAASRHAATAVLGRKAVVTHLTGSARSGDSDVRAALIDRFGGTGGKATAVGRKVSPGPLYGIANDVWSALAIAVTYADTEASR